MAFLGHMSNKGKYIGSEAIDGSKVNLAVPDGSSNAKSRTFVKSYDTESRNLVSSPGTVRYVGDSASFYELNSLADTEVSTLRYVSPRSLEEETESLTLCLSRSDNGSESSSMSEGNGYREPLKEAQHYERGSTTSMCSWEEEPMSASEDGQPNELESQSCCVPLLELGSDTASLYYDHQAHLGQLKLMRQSNEAYDNWLSAKKRQSQYQRHAAQEQREQQQQKNALRRQLNEQKVQEWCNQKAHQNVNPTKSSQIRGRPQSRLDELTLRRLQAWELNKVQQAEKRRQQQQREAMQKQQEQQQRKHKAALAWQQWVKDAAQRPKPVPLNQGLKTLRGTVSSIYVNPSQWVHVNEKQG